ncbi:MAG TPA: TldD/PmbA family protein [Clostridiales bacterium UBA8960]|jgi:PmbA protein|nr:TldD/PmbA family protein [Clostridiales bacterium UBA8960]
MDANFVSRLFERGTDKGFSEQEIYYVKNQNTEISVYEGQLDKYNLSENAGLSYRGILDGKLGYAYTEILDEDAINMLVDEAYDNAKIIEVTDQVFLHDGSGDYEKIAQAGKDESSTPIAEKIAFMFEIEKRIRAFDPRVKSISRNSYSEAVSERWIKNTKGLDVSDKVNYCFAFFMPVVEENQDTRSGLGYDISNDFTKLSMDKIVKESVEEALKMLGAKSMKSQKCPVIFKNVVFAELFSEYMGLYSADRVHKDLSGLKGKLNQKIASPLLTLVDNPLLEMGLSTSSFDAEGVATYEKPIIEQGILRTYFHNLKTAYKDGIASTGNASKASYKGTVGIAPSNLILTPGEQPLQRLIETVENGVYIVSLQGLHAGIDSISGDFSLQCYGYVIENGQLTRPVSQITVAGNYFEMLHDVEMIADDLRFSILASDYIGSASVKIKSLSISGD